MSASINLLASMSWMVLSLVICYFVVDYIIPFSIPVFLDLLIVWHKSLDIINPVNLFIFVVFSWMCSVAVWAKESTWYCTTGVRNPELSSCCWYKIWYLFLQLHFEQNISFPLHIALFVHKEWSSLFCNAIVAILFLTDLCYDFA